MRHLLFVPDFIDRFGFGQDSESKTFFVRLGFYSPKLEPFVMKTATGCDVIGFGIPMILFGLTYQETRQIFCRDDVPEVQALTEYVRSREKETEPLEEEILILG